mmetsp:Transcript_76897/g.178350  ORF Transcript_76897/g.178350 Transcript_76897/m.178350 type:complete len:134 (+) Transcript_76897:42-443(+)
MPWRGAEVDRDCGCTVTRRTPDADSPGSSSRTASPASSPRQLRPVPEVLAEAGRAAAKTAELLAERRELELKAERMEADRKERLSSFAAVNGEWPSADMPQLHLAGSSRRASQCCMGRGTPCGGGASQALGLA